FISTRKNRANGRDSNAYKSKRQWQLHSYGCAFASVLLRTTDECVVGRKQTILSLQTQWFSQRRPLRLHAHTGGAVKSLGAERPQTTPRLERIRWQNSGGGYAVLFDSRSRFKPMFLDVFCTRHLAAPLIKVVFESRVGNAALPASSI
ncbi:MAG: hypothetical protein AB7O81_34895, partial [Blastocatellales bacterium]